MIIAISGNDRSGKDTIANYFFNYLNDGTSSWKIQRFSDSVADKYKDFTGIDWRSLSTQEKSEVREQFSLFAESMKVLFGEDVWARSLDYSKNLIIPDLRFINELEIINNYPNIKIKVVKDNTSSYINELEHYKNWDIIIDNNSSLENLFLKVKTIIEEWKLQHLI